MGSNSADRVFLPLVVGGGIRTVEDVRAALLAGADKVSINTSACYHPELLSEAALHFCSQCVILSIDSLRKSDGDWEVYSHDGRKPTGLDALECAVKGVRLGAGEVLLTSMDTDERI